MNNRNYYPVADADFVVWFSNFALKLAVYAPTLGLTAQDMNAVASDCAAFAYIVNQAEAARRNTQQRIHFKQTLLHGPAETVPAPFPGPFTPAATPANAVPPGVIPRLRRLVRRIKADVHYTSAMGKDLGVVKAAQTLPAVVKPEGRVQAMPKAQVQIKFVKRGFARVQVETLRGNANNWEVLGAFARSPLVDARSLLVPGQPEVRSYRLRYMTGNHAVGDASDTLTTTTQV